MTGEHPPNGSLDPATGHTLYLHQSRQGQAAQTSHAGRLGLEYALPHDQPLTLAAQPRFNIYRVDETILSRQQNLTRNQPVDVSTSDRQNASPGHKTRPILPSTTAAGGPPGPEPLSSGGSA